MTYLDLATDAIGSGPDAVPGWDDASPVGSHELSVSATDQPFDAAGQLAAGPHRAVATRLRCPSIAPLLAKPNHSTFKKRPRH
jgi:hypothetical protein